MTHSKKQHAEYLVRFPSRRDLEEINKAYECQSAKSWEGERVAHKAIRENLHCLIQNWNDNSDNKATFKRDKRKQHPTKTEFAVEFDDGTWISVIFDANRTFPKPPKEETIEDVTKEFVKRAVTTKVITQKVKTEK